MEFWSRLACRRSSNGLCEERKLIMPFPENTRAKTFDLIKQYYQIPRPAPCPSPLRRDKEFAQGVQWMERKTDIFLVPL